MSDSDIEKQERMLAYDAFFAIVEFLAESDLDFEKTREELLASFKDPHPFTISPSNVIYQEGAYAIGRRIIKALEVRDLIVSKRFESTISSDRKPEISEVNAAG